MSTLAIRAGWLRHVMIAATQQHHLELVEPFKPFIPPDAVVIDVGAHAGQFAKLFAKMAPRGVVHAFEPSPYARSVLTLALRFSGAAAVRVHPVGLSDSPGELALHTPIKKRGGMGFGLAHLGGSGEGEVGHRVSLTTLDLFAEAERLERLDFIKADIEGWEAHMLRGGMATVRRFRPAIFLEVDDALLARAGAAPSEIWSLLAPLGYRSRRAPAFEPTDGYVGPGDYLFVPER